MKKYSGCLILGLALVFVVQPVFAKTENKQANNGYKDLKAEVDSLQKGQAVIGQDVKEIKKLIQNIQRPSAAQGGSACGVGSGCDPSACGPSAPPAPPAPFTEAIIDIKVAPIKGDKNAKLIMVEFTDYECPFCQKYARETQPQISKEYIETGKIRQVFMDYPLTSIHKMAQKAAEAGQCAQDQGKFWEMSDKLFENPNKDPKWLTPESLLKIAEDLGLDMTVFKDCLDRGVHVADIKSRIAEGGKAQMTGAPAFYLGYMMPDRKVKVTKQLKGALPFASFKTAIDEMLAEKK